MQLSLFSSIYTSCAEAFKLCTLCTLWYAVTAGNSFIGKILISEFPYPVTILATEHFFVCILSFPLMLFLRRVIQKGEKPTGLNKDTVSYFKLVVPMAILKVVQEFSGIVSVWKSTVPFSQTVKALVPFFTIIFSSGIFKEHQSLPICLSLIPVMMGVGLATATEISLNYTGLVAGMIDACFFSLLCLLIKKLLLEKGMHTFESVSILSRSSFLLVAPIWAAVELGTLLNDKDSINLILDNGNWKRILMLLGVDGLLTFLQTITASIVMAYTSVLTYALANSFKRITTIGLSFLVFNNTVKPLNIGGMCLASGGVVIYSLLKAREKTAQQEREYNLNNENLNQNENLKDKRFTNANDDRFNGWPNTNNNVQFINIIPRKTDEK